MNYRTKIKCGKYARNTCFLGPVISRIKTRENIAPRKPLFGHILRSVPPNAFDIMLMKRRNYS